MKKYLLIICIIYTNFMHSQNIIPSSISNHLNVEIPTKRIPFQKDILKMEEHYTMTLEQIGKIRNKKPNRFEIIRINTYLTDIVYEYSKGISILRENKNLSLYVKEERESIYTSIIEKALEDFQSAIKILKTGNENNNYLDSEKMISLLDIQSNMKKNKYSLIDYNNQNNSN